MRGVIVCMLGLWLLGAGFVADAGAAPAKRKATTRATAAKRPAVKTGAPAAAEAGARGTTDERRVHQRGASSPEPRPTGTAPRRLEDIHIEGEIPAPQVLFVTARDQRRFNRFHHERYLKTSLQVGEATPLPTRIALTKNPATPSNAP